MNSAVYQKTPSFDQQASSFSQKATPIAPQSEAKPVKKADGAFRTISEVADELDVPQHVLRFWETKFTQVKPLKRGGGRRYYRPEDVALLKHIYNLLYTEGYTIKGVQKLLKGQGKNQIAAQVMEQEDVQAAPVPQMRAATPQAAPVPQTSRGPVLNDNQRGALEDMLAELKELRALFPKEMDASAA